MTQSLERLAELEARCAFWILLFPNLALFLLPNHLFTLLFSPDGPEATVESTRRRMARVGRVS